MHAYAHEDDCAHIVSCKKVGGAEMSTLPVRALARSPVQVSLWLRIHGHTRGIYMYNTRSAQSKYLLVTICGQGEPQEQG